MTDNREHEETPQVEESQGPPAAPEVRTVDPGLPWAGIIATIGLVLVVVFAVQNTHSVRVEFLWWEARFTLSFVILVAAVGSALLAVLVGTLYRSRRARRKAEKEELRRLRSSG